MPGRRTTNAFTISPRSGSGLPIAALSATAACSSNALSTSKGPMRYPAEVITSSARPVNQKYPSSSRTARSPVTYQSPQNTAAVSSRSFQYRAKRDGGRPRRAMSPSAPGAAGRPSWSITSTSCPGVGRPIEPGLTSALRVFATRSVFSVCPYPSWIVMPNASRKRAITSGFSGSPAETACRRRESGYRSRSSSFAISRYSVGDWQRMVTPRRSMMSKRSRGSNGPSWSTISAPRDHGPSSTFQIAFAQPVAAVHQTRSPGRAPSQCSACMREAKVYPWVWVTPFGCRVVPDV